MSPPGAIAPQTVNPQGSAHKGQIMDLYSIPSIREHAELIVRNEVFYCVSSLVSTIIQAPETWRALDIDEDEIYSISECLDYDEPAAERIAAMARDELCEYLDSQDVEYARGEETDDGETIGGATDAELRALARAAMAEEGAREFCDGQGTDPYHSEVFEHWIVSSWLADKLDAAGHPIARDFLGLTIWGRPTTGQGIALDSVILEIARDCLKD